MEKQSFELAERRIVLFADEEPQILFLQPVDAHDAELPGRQVEAMRDCPLPFALAAFEVKDWNRDLSPWESPPVFGKTPFGGAAEETLDDVTEHLLPALRERLTLDGSIGICLGGYSLAGLFALWAGTKTDLFSGIAAASPSVWFPGWLDYLKAHPLLAETVYLSLGDREERTRNPVMARVGDCIRETHALLRDTHRVTLEWNPGNHFQDSEKRTARAFCRIAETES